MTTIKSSAEFGQTLENQLNCLEKLLEILIKNLIFSAISNPKANLLKRHKALPLYYGSLQQEVSR